MNEDTNGSEPSLLTAHERDEWGDPRKDSNIEKLMLSYCPLTNSNNTHSKPVGNHHPISMYISVGAEDRLANPIAAVLFAINIRKQVRPQQLKRSAHIHILVDSLTKHHHLGFMSTPLGLDGSYDQDIIALLAKEIVVLERGIE
jgi:hypothetical protein